MIYLDHAATSPLDPRVRDAMLEAMEKWGNPSSPHAKGRESRSAIDASRQTIADLLGVHTHEVVFVASGSEGNSLALFGFCQKWIADGKKPGRVLALAIEHECSIKALQKLQRSGWSVTLLPVDEFGRVHMSDVEAAITEDTAILSIQLANNEVGTLQPIEEISALCKERGITFHCDAVQGIGLVPFPAVDMATIAAHKFYGPKGIGVLTVRDGIRLEPQILGGGQEFDLRAGTENTPAIVGMAKALEIAMEEMTTEAERLKALRDTFEKDILTLPGTSVNGHSVERLPNFTSIRFTGKKAESLVIQFDLQGICVSAGAACQTGAATVSHVLTAMGRDDAAAQENIRFTLGRFTTKEELDAVLKVLRP